MSNQKKVFLILLLLVSIGVLYLIRDYIGIISISLLVVLMFNPVYKRLLNSFKGKKSIATTLVMLIIFLSLIIPVVTLIFFTSYQVNAVAKDLKEANFSRSDLGKVTTDSLNSINNTLKQNSINYQLTPEDLNSGLNQGLKSGGSALLNVAGNLGSRLPEFITNIILFIVLLSFFFPAQDGIIKGIRKISPISDEVTNIYLSRMAAMARSMINGTFVVALIQGLIGGITLWLVGVPYPLFFTFILIIASVIPLLGSGLILIPAGLVLIATGNLWAGIIVLLVQIVLISNIDNVLRPKLIEEDAKLPEAITLLGIIAGISTFGILGLIFGPVIMVIAYTTYDIYLKYYAISIKNYLNKDN